MLFAVTNVLWGIACFCHHVGITATAHEVRKWQEGTLTHKHSAVRTRTWNRSRRTMDSRGFHVFHRVGLGNSKANTQHTSKIIRRGSSPTLACFRHSGCYATMHSPWRLEAASCLASRPHASCAKRSGLPARLLPMVGRGWQPPEAGKNIQNSWPGNCWPGQKMNITKSFHVLWPAAGAMSFHFKASRQWRMWKKQVCQNGAHHGYATTPRCNKVCRNAVCKVRPDQLPEPYGHAKHQTTKRKYQNTSGTPFINIKSDWVFGKIRCRCGVLY